MGTPGNGILIKGLRTSSFSVRTLRISVSKLPCSPPGTDHVKSEVVLKSAAALLGFESADLNGRCTRTFLVTYFVR